MMKDEGGEDISSLFILPTSSLLQHDCSTPLLKQFRKKEL